MTAKLAVSLQVQNISALNDSQNAALADLQVSKHQEFLGGSFSESLEAWQNGPRNKVLGLCFLSDGQPVGMTLFKRPPVSPDWAPEDAATIHGLKIATPWQGLGWGHKAFELAVEHLKKDWPSVNSLRLAVDADNEAALAVYRAFGMVDSGPVFEGTHGLEHRFKLSLKS